MSRKAPISLNALERAVIHTLSYSAIFKYPLDLNELHRYLIRHRATREELLQSLQSRRLEPVLRMRDGFYFLRGQDDLPALRDTRERFTRDVLLRNRWLLKLICAIPYIRLVALSGSAAHYNLTPDGDIDLFLVTKTRRPWSVALALVLLTRILGKRKLVCCNFITSEEELWLPPGDLFTANQIASLQVLTGEETARRLFAQNPFVTFFYPNVEEIQNAGLQAHPGRWLGRFKGLVEKVLSFGPAQVFERLSYRFYGSYLLRRAGFWATPEEVRLTPQQLKLHTHGHRKAVYERYERMLDKAGKSLGCSLNSPVKAPAATGQARRTNDAATEGELEPS